MNSKIGNNRNMAGKLKYLCYIYYVFQYFYIILILPIFIHNTFTDNDPSSGKTSKKNRKRRGKKEGGNKSTGTVGVAEHIHKVDPVEDLRQKLSEAKLAKVGNKGLTYVRHYFMFNLNHCNSKLRHFTLILFFTPFCHLLNIPTLGLTFIINSLLVLQPN